MNYRNGPLHVPLSTFYVLYFDRVALSSHRKRLDREILSLGTEKIDSVRWGGKWFTLLPGLMQQCHDSLSSFFFL